MKTDLIAEIGIDKMGRMYIRPTKALFPLIYRTATEVHWDTTNLSLYSPKPREWTYFDWYKHIIRVVENECNYQLVLSDDTIWVNIYEELRMDIIRFV